MRKNTKILPLLTTTPATLASDQSQLGKGAVSIRLIQDAIPPHLDRHRKFHT